MNRLFRHPWGWASLAPIVCAIHCLAVPVVVVLSPTLAPGKTVEWMLLGLTAALAVGALVSVVRRRGEFVPLVPVIVGLIAWTGSLMHLYRPVPEELTTVAASLTVAAGLIWYSRVQCASKATPCSACRHELEEALSLPVSEREPSPTLEAR